MDTQGAGATGLCETTPQSSLQPIPFQTWVSGDACFHFSICSNSVILWQDICVFTLGLKVFLNFFLLFIFTSFFCVCVLAEWGVGGGKMNICRGQRSTLVSSQPFFFFFLCVTGSLTEHAFTFQQAWLASEAPSSQGSPFPVLQVHTVVPKCCTVWLDIWIQVLLHLLQLSYGLSRLSKLPSLGFSFCMELYSSCPSVCLCLSNILELLDPCCLPASARSQGFPIISLQTQYEIVHGAQRLKKFFRSQVSFLNDSITLQVSESL